MSTRTPVASTSTAPTALEQFWRARPAAALAPIRESLATFPSAPLRVSRVAQLDAALLDTELESILHQPVKSALEGITTWGRGWEPEVLALLRYSVLRMSLWSTSEASYGAGLQNLRYRNEARHSSSGLQSTAIDSRLSRGQKVSYTALFVLGPYLHARLQDRMLGSSWADEPLPRSWISLVDPTRVVRAGRRSLGSGRGGGGGGGGGAERRAEEWIEWKREWKRTVWELVRVSDKLGQILGLANFLVFLYNGRYRTVVDRILSMRLVYSQRTASPNVSFEYLNRQLVWEAFTEFLLFLMPLINLRRMRLKFSKALTRQTSRSKTLRAIATSLPASVSRSLGLGPVVAESSSGEAGGRRPRRGRLEAVDRATCPICHDAAAGPPTRLPPSVSAASIADPTNPSSQLSSTAGGSGSGGGGDVVVSDTSVKVPYVTNCVGTGGCRYCYYCLVGALAECDERVEDGWECLRCGQQVTEATRERESVNREDKDDDDDDEEEEEDRAASVVGDADAAEILSS